MNAEFNNFLLYTNDSGEVKLDVLLRDETIWMTINQMGELFGIDKSGISRHIKNIYVTKELQQETTVAKNATVHQKGKRQVPRHFTGMSESCTTTSKRNVIRNKIIDTSSLNKNQNNDYKSNTTYTIFFNDMYITERYQNKLVLLYK